jgi:hypothetical protein
MKNLHKRFYPNNVYRTKNGQLVVFLGFQELLAGKNVIWMNHGLPPVRSSLTNFARLRVPRILWLFIRSFTEFIGKN